MLQLQGAQVVALAGQNSSSNGGGCFGNLALAVMIFSCAELFASNDAMAQSRSLDQLPTFRTPWAAPRRIKKSVRSAKPKSRDPRLITPNGAELINSEKNQKRTGGTNKLILIPGSLPGILLIKQDGNTKGVRRAEWSATLNLSLQKVSCTGTLIGPRVLLTAAHCLRGLRRFALDVRVEDQMMKIGLNCTPHRAYRFTGRGIRFDYALCYLSRPYPTKVFVSVPVKVKHLRAAMERLKRLRKGRSVTVQNKLNLLLKTVTSRLRNDDAVLRELDVSKLTPELVEPLRKQIGKELDANPNELGYERAISVKFERLSIQRRDARYRFRDALSRIVLMAGYGCTDRRGKRGNDGTLRAGAGRISRFGPVLLTIGSRRRNDSAIICPGDSGGAAFRVKNFNAEGPRKIIAINARYLVTRRGIGNLSFLAKTSSRAFIRFFRAWRARYGNPKVCGIDPGMDAICHK